jgi:hypothetical protein
MGHRINTWVSRLLVPFAAVAAMTMMGLGLGIWKTIAIVLPVVGLAMVVMTIADPGPRAKELIDELKSRLR